MCYKQFLKELEVLKKIPMKKRIYMKARFPYFFVNTYSYFFFLMLFIF